MASICVNPFVKTVGKKSCLGMPKSKIFFTFIQYCDVLKVEHFQVGQLPFCSSLAVIFIRATRRFLEVDVLNEEGGSRHSLSEGRSSESKLLTSGRT